MERRRERGGNVLGEGLRRGGRRELLETIAEFGLREEESELAVDPRGEPIGAGGGFVGAAVAPKDGSEGLERAELGQNGVRIAEERKQSEQLDGEVERAALHAREHALQIGLQSA